MVCKPLHRSHIHLTSKQTRQIHPELHICMYGLKAVPCTQVGGNTPTAQEAYRPQFGGGGRVANGPAQPKLQEPHGMGPPLPPGTMQYHKAQQMALHKRMQAHHRVQRPAAPLASSAPVAPPRPPSWAPHPIPSWNLPRPWAKAEDGREQASASVQYPSVISPPNGPPPDGTPISDAIDPALQSFPGELPRHLLVDLKEYMCIWQCS